MKFFPALILLLIPSVINADAATRLEQIENFRLENFAKTKELIAELESEYPNFSELEKARFLNLKAHSLMVHGEIEDGISFATKVAKVTSDFDQLARAKSLIATAYAMSGRHKDFFVDTYELLDELDKIQSMDLRQSILSNALVRHTSARVFDKARELANTALAYGHKTKTQLFICNGHIELTRIEVLSGNTDQAQESLSRAEENCKNLATPIAEFTIKYLNARIDKNNGQLTQAKKIIDSMHERLLAYGWKASILKIEILLSEINLKLGNLNEVEKYALSAYKYSKKYNDYEHLKDACNLLSKYYLELGQKDKSKQYYQEYLEASVEFFSQIESKKMAYYQAMNSRSR